MLGEKLRTRLGMVIQASGYSPTRLSQDMGKGRNWLSRKLGAADASRALSIEDCEEVMAFLGESDSLLMQPLMLANDLQVLCFVQGQHGWIGEPTVCGIFRDADESLGRLAGQGLITRKPPNCRATGHGQLIAEERAPHVALATPTTVR